MEPGSRRNNLDFVRWVLAASVICSHAFQIAIGAGLKGLDPLGKFTGQIDVGGVAVDMFFVISGYLILQSRSRCPTTGRFLWKRCCRIIPAFTLAFLASAFVIGYIGAANPSTYFGQLFQHSFFDQIYRLATVTSPWTPAVFPLSHGNPGINPQVWTIRYEEACYIGLAVLYALWLYRSKWAVGLMFVLSLGWYVYEIRANVQFAFGLPRLAACFLFGSVLWHFRDKIPFSKTGIVVAAAVLIASEPLGFLRSAMILCGGYLVMAFALAPSARFAKFSKHGDFSYGTYLYGRGVQSLVYGFIPLASPWVHMVVSIPLATAAGAVSWFAVERKGLALKDWNPFRQKRHIFKAHREVEPALAPE